MTHMHALSDGDREFVRAFEEHEIPPAEFSHRAHVRLAYAYLVGSSAAEASAAMRATLLTFLSHHGIDPGKYHETLTRSWILAVRHFMERSAPAGSADEFIAANPALLDTGIMLTHYRATTLFSEEARARFVLPDLDAIPNQDG